MMKVNVMSSQKYQCVFVCVAVVLLESCCPVRRCDSANSVSWSPSVGEHVCSGRVKGIGPFLHTSAGGGLQAPLMLMHMQSLQMDHIK